MYLRIQLGICFVRKYEDPGVKEDKECSLGSMSRWDPGGNGVCKLKKSRQKMQRQEGKNELQVGPKRAGKTYRRPGDRSHLSRPRQE